MNQDLQKQDLIELADRVKTIIVETVFASSMALIEGKHQVGEEIVKDILYKKYGKGSGELIKDLAREIGRSEQDLYFCVQFYNKYPVLSNALETLPEGKKLSWRKIIELLPEPKTNKIEIDIPKGEYDLIVIDPPWKYGTEFNSESRRVASPYPELSQEELKKVKMPAAEDSSLWLWTTHKFIWDAKELMDLWGFEYKGVLTWNKEKLGMGAWLRMQTEFCLLGIKGKPKWNLTNERDIISESRREHSRKPDGFYSMIEKLTGAKNKIDIFGREGRKDWEVWGNETEKF